MSGVQIFRTGLWALIALLGGAAVWLFVFQGGHRDTSMEPPYGAPFQLVDQNGATITEAAFVGRPSAVFFGYTHCPDVCPTTMLELAGYQKAMKAKGRDLAVYFVTVDPERDTPAILKSYVDAVAPDLKAISGPPDKVAGMLKDWGVYFKKVGDGPDYLMDHTATTFLIDAKGRFFGTLDYKESPKTAEQKLDRLTDS